MARDALKIYLRRIGDLRLHQVVQVERVTEQIVAGMITRINFIAVITNCNAKDVVQKIDLSKLLVCKSEHLSLLSGKTEIKVNCLPILM